MFISRFMQIISHHLDAAAELGSRSQTLIFALKCLVWYVCI